MRKTIKFSVLLAMVSVTAFISPLKAQDVKKEIEGYVKKFQEAYNKKDDQAIKMMYTDDAVRTDATGKTITGNENIRAAFVESWANSKLTLDIKPEKEESNTDSTVTASGTYHVTGSTTAGEKIDINGTYVNTLVKENGTWKMSKSVLGNL